MVLLEPWVGKNVTVITNEGRCVVGTLRGFDQFCNLVLEASIERVFSSDAALEEVALGLCVIKGDNLYVNYAGSDFFFFFPSVWDRIFAMYHLWTSLVDAPKYRQTCTHIPKETHFIIPEDAHTNAPHRVHQRKPTYTNKKTTKAKMSGRGDAHVN